MSQRQTGTSAVEPATGRRPLCSLAGAQRPCVYDVVPGDSMSQIADTFGVSLDSLESTNFQIPNPNEIFPGDELIIPQS